MSMQLHYVAVVMKIMMVQTYVQSKHFLYLKVIKQYEGLITFII